MAEQARKLASQGRWLDAVEVNKQLIERSPRDVDALNRLGKAYFELDMFRSAYEVYEKAADADPANIIARRNLERIEPLRDFENESPANPEVLPPDLNGVFIEEAGKTYVDELIVPASVAELRTISSGSKLEIDIDPEDPKRVYLVDFTGIVVGRLEPIIAQRMVQLISTGSTYEVYVTSNAGDSVRVIIREVERSPALGRAVSFPDQGKVSTPRSYKRDSRLFRGGDDILLEMGSDGDDDLDDQDYDDEDDDDGPREFDADFDDDDDDTEFIPEE